MTAFNKWKALFSGLLILAFASACQSTGGYTVNTQPTIPVKSNYQDDNEYRVRLALFLIPRGCVTTRYYGGNKANADPSQRVQGSFRIFHLRENAGTDTGWYEIRGSINKVYGEFYINADDPRQFTCGKSNFMNNFVKDDPGLWKSGDIVLTGEQIEAMILGGKQV